LNPFDGLIVCLIIYLHFTHFVQSKGKGNETQKLIKWNEETN